MENHYLAIAMETANADNSSNRQNGLAEFAAGQILEIGKSILESGPWIDPFLIDFFGFTGTGINANLIALRSSWHLPRSQIFRNT